MRIESVTADAFGPLVGETLTLSPGLTVLHGDNESAKSSWHAAIYAALCGRRRGRGAGTADDRDFAAQRRPWDGSAWRVRCVVSLDDGRRIDLQHDLDGKVDCRAVDERGRDVSGEIMYDGAPDGSRWLGLNRRTFAATACVNQAELLRVLEAADELQKDLQRAATSAGKDETAAAALAALKAFRRSAVGRDQANSRRPLRSAIDQLRSAEAAHAEAQRAHADYLLLVADSEAATEAAATAGAARRQAATAQAAAEQVVQATLALSAAREAAEQSAALAETSRAQAVRQQDRLDRAVSLSNSLPDAEPASGNSDDAVAQRVASAIGGWQSAPENAPLTGLSSAELQAQIDELPPMPAGDIAVDPSIERLRDAHLRASAVADRTRQSRVDPPGDCDPRVAAAVRAGPATLRYLAERLSEPVAELDPRLVADRENAADQRTAAAAALDVAEREESTALEALRRGDAVTRESAPARILPLAAAAGALLLVIGGALLMSGLSVAGSLVAALGAATLATSALLVRRPGAPGRAVPRPVGEIDLERARAEVRERRDQRMLAERRFVDSDARLEAAEATSALRAGRLQAAAAEAADLGLPVDAASLPALAERAQRVVARRESCARWQEEFTADSREQQATGQRLAAALAESGYNHRGGTQHGDVLQAFEAYERDCDERHEQARQAGRCEELLRQLSVRIESERAAERAQLARAAAAAQLVSTAELAGVVPADARESLDSDEVAMLLREWLDSRSAALQRTDAQRRRWQELQALLDGLTVDDLAAAVSSQLATSVDDDLAAEAAIVALTSATRDLHRALRDGGVVAPPSQSAARELLRLRRAEHEEAATVERELGQLASNQQGKSTERALAIPGVAEAEEAVERAQLELQRVRSLDQVLALTASFLEKAQDRAYSDLAPALNKTLDKWLPQVTSGRYRRARVNPETLEVLVESETGALRRAELLSVGTAEQVYLLLRVALAEHLATRSTVSPLLLDDVTVQADLTRTAALLRMCKALADEGRQVVLFSQEPTVATWAEDNLDGITSRLVRLTVSAAA